MIVIFESKITDRAVTFRDILLAKGYPCAVCDPSTIGHMTPMLAIVAFSEEIDAIRTLPYDDVPVIAYGEGFVNRALNAVKAENIDTLLQSLGNVVRRYCREQGWSDPTGEGIFCAPGVYLTRESITVYGSRMELPEAGVLVLRCLLFAGKDCRSADQLAAYCCSSDNKTSANIRVHIFNINETASARLPKPLIESVYGKGYRFGYFEGSLTFSPAD